MAGAEALARALSQRQTALSQRSRRRSTACTILIPNQSLAPSGRQQVYWVVTGEARIDAQ